jgi:hypothetical protein
VDYILVYIDRMEDLDFGKKFPDLWVFQSDY